MDYICLHDKKKIAAFLKKNIFLHIYSIGDLDDFFWPYTIWYGCKADGHIEAIALLYVGMPLPTLLALSEEPGVKRKLLQAIQHLLPVRFYAHLSPGLGDVLNERHDLTSHGVHSKMALTDTKRLSEFDCSEVERLGMKDLRAIKELYRAGYPENWFDLRMLETDKYVGIWQDTRLVSIAGIHVYSPRYKVAALGNITTHPAYRGKGYGLKVTVRLCQELIDEGMHIGLNVKADNMAALSCYKKIGFHRVALYEEFMMQKKGAASIV